MRKPPPAIATSDERNITPSLQPTNGEDESTLSNVTALLESLSETDRHPNGKAIEAKQAATPAPRPKTGVVVSAGKMQKTVKFFSTPTNYLVHDPNSSTNEGDIVSLTPLRTSKHVHHVISAIIAPFGKPVEERPPVPTAGEREKAYRVKRTKKFQRKKLRTLAANSGDQGRKEWAQATLKRLGLDLAEASVAKGREKGGLRGRNKGQIPPKGVLPSGKKVAGKTNERAQSDKPLRRKAAGSINRAGG
ncbi:hypothetical protein LTR28_005003 [Elasticomyces elasticus]|nr:hypothetical protein LTR28_005003 [Elasticomyces elasticus]